MAYTLARADEQTLPVAAEGNRFDHQDKIFAGGAALPERDNGFSERDNGLSRRLALRSVAAYVAHELNHPLGTIANLAALLSRRIGDPVIRPSELASQIVAVKHETRRAADVVKNLRILAGSLHGHSEAVNLNAFLREAVKRFRRRYGKDNVSVRVECRDHSLGLQAVPGLLHIALYNLLINAVEAPRVVSGKKPRLTLRANQMARERLMIDVIDDGPGVGETVKGRMFEPFVSDKPGGSGLGLAICRDIVEWHGGILSYEETASGKGACFRISLPKE